MTRSYGLVRTPVGADPATYRPGIRKERRTRAEAQQARFDNLSPEEQARERQERVIYDQHMVLWRKEFDELGPARANELLRQRRAQSRALDKLADREARTAVEGGTDLNHDNIEAAE